MSAEQPGWTATVNTWLQSEDDHACCRNPDGQVRGAVGPLPPARQLRPAESVLPILQLRLTYGSSRSS